MNPPIGHAVLGAPPSTFSLPNSPKIEYLRSAYSNGEKLSRIDLADVGLDHFPLDLLYPFRDTVEFINFGGNNLSSLPDEVTHFKKLKILFFAQNKFQTVPKVLGSLPSLYMLSFKSNEVQYVPEESLSPSIHWLILTDNRIKGDLDTYL